MTNIQVSHIFQFISRAFKRVKLQQNLRNWIGICHVARDYGVITSFSLAQKLISVATVNVTLTLFFLVFPFDPPENRKPNIFCPLVRTRTCTYQEVRNIRFSIL